MGRSTDDLTLEEKIRTILTFSTEEGRVRALLDLVADAVDEAVAGTAADTHPLARWSLTGGGHQPVASGPMPQRPVCPPSPPEPSILDTLRAAADSPPPYSAGPHPGDVARSIHPTILDDLRRDMLAPGAGGCTAASRAIGTPRWASAATSPPDIVLWADPGVDGTPWIVGATLDAVVGQVVGGADMDGTIVVVGYAETRTLHPPRVGALVRAVTVSVDAGAWIQALRR